MFVAPYYSSASTAFAPQIKSKMSFSANKPEADKEAVKTALAEGNIEKMKGFTQGQSSEFKEKFCKIVTDLVSEDEKLKDSGRLAVDHLLTDEDRGVINAAIETLPVLGNSKDVYDYGLPNLDSPYTGRAAKQIVGNFGEPGDQKIIDRLFEVSEIRYPDDCADGALELMGKMGKGKPETIDFMIESFKGSSDTDLAIIKGLGDAYVYADKKGKKDIIEVLLDKTVRGKNDYSYEKINEPALETVKNCVEKEDKEMAKVVIDKTYDQLKSGQKRCTDKLLDIFSLYGETDKKKTEECLWNYIGESCLSQDIYTDEIPGVINALEILDNINPKLVSKLRDNLFTAHLQSLASGYPGLSEAGKNNELITNTANTLIAKFPENMSKEEKIKSIKYSLESIKQIAKVKKSFTTYYIFEAIDSTSRIKSKLVREHIEQFGI